MTGSKLIESLFVQNIRRRIEEVIKVDQTDAEVIRAEIDEYVVTDSIRKHYTEILESYAETPNKPHEGIAVWVSGFFGSGKSSFAKMLGLTIENPVIAGERAAERFAARASDAKLAVLLKTITEKIPTHAVIFDVSTDRGIRSGNQTLTEIMYGLFLRSLGYAKDLDLSELEVSLEERGALERFEDTYRRLFDKEWAQEKDKVAFALSEASRVMHELDRATYPQADSWVQAVKNKADITPRKLAERAGELMSRRKPGHSLLFVVDEVGQFVARDVQKMLDLQAIVQNLGVRGRGKYWVVVTSQEKLNEIVSAIDDRKIELQRLMDRFPLQVHLEPSDISEVTSRRVLRKNAEAEALLGALFDAHRGSLTAHTRLTADFKLPELSRERFIDLYPLLPYQIDLIIRIVSGLRLQGGASRHVGGANRTIIKLAQQLLVNPAVDLAASPVGVLVRLDQVYDLIEGNIGSDIRAKIAAIPKLLRHPLAASVAKAICLLQYVQSVHRTPENIAAALHPSVSGEPQLAAVREALRELEATHQVRQGEGGYRIPTPAEDDWDRQRNGLVPKPADLHRLYAEVLASFWQPQPVCILFEAKTFKAGLVIHGREAVDGDIPFQFYLADSAQEFDSLAAELRERSQTEQRQVFWAIALSDAIDHEALELYRSKEILVRKERETKGEQALALVTEERARERRHREELRRLLLQAALTGRVYFRGNDRSPGDAAVDVRKAAAEILAQVLPEVFDRFKEAAAKGPDVKKGLEALLTSDSLQGLPPVFMDLALLRDERGKTVFHTEGGPLKEILARIEERSRYGETASGRYLTEEFAKEPFGWDFEVVRLLVLSLLRAGRIEAISKGQTLEVATTLEARETFSNNNLFRQASFRPKRGIEFAELVRAAQAFKEAFGNEIRELVANTIAAQLRDEIGPRADTVVSVLSNLTAHRLPGGGVLESALGQMKAILRGSDESAITTFNASHKTIQEAVQRAAELEQVLTEPRLRDLERARQALEIAWPFLKTEPGIPLELASRAEALAELLGRETFFRDVPAIEQHARALELEYARRFDDAQQARIDAYTQACERLAQVPGWSDLPEETRREIAAPLLVGREPLPRTAPIPLLRSEREACEGRLRSAIQRVREIIEGERLATVQVQTYFGEGIDTIEQLDAALGQMHDECVRLIVAGKKVVLT